MNMDGMGIEFCPNHLLKILLDNLDNTAEMDAEIEMAFAEFDMGDMDMGQVYDFY